MGWTVWSDKLAGTTHHALASVVFKNKMHVFAVGVNDKTIWVKSSGDGEHWGEWQNFEKQTDAAVTPVVFDDVLFVFAKELDYKISVRSKARTGGWSAWESFNGTSKTALAAAAFHSVLYVFKTRSNNQVDFHQARTAHTRLFQTPRRCAVSASVGGHAVAKVLNYFSNTRLATLTFCIIL